MRSLAAIVAALGISRASGFVVDPSIHVPVSLIEDSSSNLIASSTAVLDRYLETLANHPLQTKMATGACLATVGDFVAQRKDGGDWDAPRGASFAAFDATYRAAQHVAFPLIVATCQGQSFLGAAMERSLASQLIIVPFFYYPVFFLFTGIMQGLDLSDSLDRAKQNFVPLMKRNLLFWVPVQWIQFNYIQTDLQIPFLSCAGLAWTIILSALAGSAKKHSEIEEVSAILDGTAEVHQETKGAECQNFPIIIDEVSPQTFVDRGEVNKREIRELVSK